MREELKATVWDLVVIDEAHKLRNAYRPSNKVGQGIRWAQSSTMSMLWNMEKSELQMRHILFQEKDRKSYIKAMLKVVSPG